MNKKKSNQKKKKKKNYLLNQYGKRGILI